ncbi:MAG: hypothetical protein O3A46_11315, partial [Candidatus Poribacteria bacterium]|nr:hypothetical protein [Candidatus Poribacteria bacterium]
MIAWCALIAPSAFAQDATMEVTERGADEKASRITLDFVNAEAQALMQFLSRETNLTIIAKESDLQNKKFSLVNLRNVTVPEAIEKIKIAMMQFDLAMIQTDSTIIITTVQQAVKMQVPVSRGSDPAQIADSDTIITHVIPLLRMRADQMAERFKQNLPDSSIVYGDTETNSLVITSTASSIKRITEIIRAMENAPSSPLRIKVFTMKNTAAEDVRDALNDVFRRNDSQGSNYVQPILAENDGQRRQLLLDQLQTVGLEVLRGEVQIEEVQNTNQIVVRASSENLEIIGALIGQMDVSPAVQTEFKVFRLKYGNAETVSENLQEIITGEGGGGGGGRKKRNNNRPWWEQQRGGGNNEGLQGVVGEVRIAFDERLNAIIVATDPRNYGIIQALLDELDQEDEPADEIEIFFLKNADAATMVTNINELIQGQEEESNVPWWFNDRNQSDTPAEGTFGLRGVVNLTADTRLNAIVAATSQSNISVLKRLVERMDVNMPEQEWGTRIIQLKYADAENIANILNSVYQGSSGNQQGGGFFNFLQRSNTRNQSRGSLAGNVVASAYPTTNSLIVSTSTTRNFSLIQEFIDELDTPTPPEQREITEVINLEYSDADQLATLLGDLWQDDSQGGGGGGGGGFFGALLRSQSGQVEQNDINSLSGKVRLLADPQTNSLVVQTRSRYVEDVRNLLAKLDIVRGQVWIEVTILEITLDDTTKLGLEMELTERRLFGVDAFGKNRRPGSNPITGTFSSDVGLNDEISGFSLSMATNEYMAFLHTLMRQNKVRTLSRVPLFVRDNQTATFSSGRDIPYLQSARTSDFVESQIFDFAFLENIGINIEITPHIARVKSRGTERRTIGLEITQVNASNFLEFTSFNAPVTEDSTIQTFIDAEDGQQIVIGGLKKQKTQSVEEKIPILGDLPLLGRLFKNTEDVTQDSE